MAVTGSETSSPIPQRIAPATFTRKHSTASRISGPTLAATTSNEARIAPVGVDWGAVVTESAFLSMIA